MPEGPVEEPLAAHDSDRGRILWIDRPQRIAPPYLRWALLRGTTSEGRILWRLSRTPAPARHEEHEEYWLAVPDVPSPEQLKAAMAPIVGRPIADTLADEARGVLWASEVDAE